MSIFFLFRIMHRLKIECKWIKIIAIIEKLQCTKMLPREQFCRVLIYRGVWNFLRLSHYLISQRLGSEYTSDIHDLAHLNLVHDLAHLNLVQPSAVFHIETSHLICIAVQIKWMVPIRDATQAWDRLINVINSKSQRNNVILCNSFHTTAVILYY